jgi:gamma-glutamylcyclotransferase (GGCT)/AIG2-like uncharacterized protein YtfP
MLAEVWQAVVGGHPEPLKAMLGGYARFRVRDTFFPGIIATPTIEPLEGKLYLGLNPKLLSLLDQFEGDLYYRQLINVQASDGRQHRANTYVVRPENRHLLTNEPWCPKNFATSGKLDRFLAQTTAEKHPSA